MKHWSKPLIPALSWTVTAAVFTALVWLRPESDGHSLFIFIAVIAVLNTAIWWKNVIRAGRRGQSDE